MAKKVIPSKHSLPKVADRLRTAGKSFSCPAFGASSLPSTVLWCLISLARARVAKAPWNPASVRRRLGIPKRRPAALPLSATTGGYSTTATVECIAAERMLTTSFHGAFTTGVQHHRGGRSSEPICATSFRACLVNCAHKYAVQ
ncbi:unnamed protein product [Ixodes pacificus]